jgi:uncharacterized membrane protein YkoI
MSDRRVFLQWLCLALTSLAVPARAGTSTSHAGKEIVGDGDHDEDDRDDGPESARAAVAAGRATPLRKLLEIVKRRYPGEVVGVKLRAHGDSLVYRIKILEHGGHLVTVGIDAVTHRFVAPGEL